MSRVYPYYFLNQHYKKNMYIYIYIYIYCLHCNNMLRALRSEGVNLHASNGIFLGRAYDRLRRRTKSLCKLNELIQNTFCTTWNSSTGSNFGQMFWYLHQSQWLNTFFEIKSSSLLIISVMAIDWQWLCWCCGFSWSWQTVCSGLLLQYKICFGQFLKSGVQVFD